jgi:replicative DNA helicase
MDRRSFVKMFGALPLLKIFKSQRTFGFDRNNQARFEAKPNSILKIIEDARPGQLIMIASRPCVGKSSVALNLLNKLGVEQSEACAYFSLEMSKENLMIKRMAVASAISFGKIKKGTLSETEQNLLNQLSQSIFKENIFINYDSKISAGDVAIKLKDLKRSGRVLKFVFVDYVNLMSSEQNRLSRCDQVPENLRQLKEIALNEDIIMIAMAQLNKGSHGRPEGRPVLADFRETQDLTSIDKLILLHREDPSSGEFENQYSDLDFLIYNSAMKTEIGFSGKLNKLTLKIRDLILDA